MIVYKNPQRQWLAGAEAELAQRIQERDNLSVRIAQLEQTIAALKSVLPPDVETEEVSLPMLCLQILSFGGANYQTIPLIRDGLTAIGIQVGGQNPLAVLHTALGRLATNGLAEAKPRTTPSQYRITNAGLTALQNR